MPSIFTAEEIPTSKPLLLLYCDDATLLQRLVTNYRSQFTVILITENAESFTAADDLYIVPHTSANMIPTIREKIDYGIITLSTKIDANVLPHVLRKLKKDHAKTALCIPVAHPAEYLELLREFSHTDSIKLLLYGDLFDGHIPFDNPLSKIIGKAIIKKQVGLSGNDLHAVYPISVPDFIRGINFALFGSHKKRALLYLFYHHPQTVISAIHLLKRAEPDLEIQYHPPETHSIRRVPLELLENELQKNSIAMPLYIDHLNGFEKSVAALFEEKPHEHIPVKTRRKPSHTKSKHIFGTFIKAAAFGLLLFIGVNVLLGFIGLQEVIAAQKSAKNGDIPTALTHLQNARRVSSLTHPTIDLFAPLLQRTVPEYYQTYTTGFQTLQSINHNTVDSLVSQGAPSTKDDLLKRIAEITYIYFHLEELKKGVIPLPITNFGNSFSQLTSAGQMAPDILGYNKPQFYLVLFQNESELRPTGGFIGSVGELTLENGKVADFKIKDVYDIDGQIKGHIEPPFVVRRNLQPHLYLRDSNFSPIFENSATMSAQLYTLGMGKDVDGIIAVNFEVLRKLLEITGPIELARFKTTVTADNAMDLVHETIEDNKFPGSSQKKDILNAIFNNLVIRMEDDPALAAKFAGLIPELLQTKNIQLASPNAPIQKGLSANGLSGNTISRNHTKNPVVSDTLGVFEANIGVNKANKQVTRSISYETTLEASRSSEVTLTIKNQNQRLAYKSYIQVMVPANSSVSEILIDRKPQEIIPAITDPEIYEARGFEEPGELELETSRVGENTVFGFEINVRPGAEQVITVAYELPRVTIPTQFTYSLDYIKQSGTGMYPLTVTINYPDGYTTENTEGKIDNSAVTFSEELKTDKVFQVDLTKGSN